MLKQSDAMMARAGRENDRQLCGEDCGGCASMGSTRIAMYVQRSLSWAGGVNWMPRTETELDAEAGG